ncbi:MAG: ribulose-phosphate 3-epimerase [Treponema sp.]
MKSDFILSPSLLSADFCNLEKSIRQVEEKTNWLHLDVMDGHFVPNLTFGYPLIKSIRKITDMVFDAHLMVENPSDFVEVFAEAGVDFFTFHAEACIHVDRLVNAIHESNMKAGISIVPTTPLSVISEILPIVDMVLVMTVNPGFSGQKFIPYCVEKIRKLAEAKKEKGYSYYVSVDGGINNKTFPIVLEAGADVVVSGSSFFSGELNI